MVFYDSVSLFVKGSFHRAQNTNTKQNKIQKQTNKQNIKKPPLVNAHTFYLMTRYTFSKPLILEPESVRIEVCLDSILALLQQQRTLHMYAPDVQCRYTGA